MKSLPVFLLAPLLITLSLWRVISQFHAAQELEKEVVFLSEKIHSTSEEKKKEVSLNAQLDQADPLYVQSHLPDFMPTHLHPLGKWREVELEQRQPQLMNAEELKQTLCLIEGTPVELYPGRPPLFIKEFHLTKSEKEEKYLIQMHLLKGELCE